MHSFTDTRGTTWDVSITIAEVKRIKARIDMDVAQISPELIGRIVDEPELLGDLLWCLCERQAEERQLDDVAFFGRLAGDALDQATNAFLEELVDFFPPWRGAPLRKALTKLTQLERRASEAAMKMLDGPELEAEIDRQLQTFGPPSTDSLESSDSIRDPSP